MVANKKTWKSSVSSWVKQLQTSSPSLASLILCADFLTEDDSQVTLLVNNKFNQQILKKQTVLTQLLTAAAQIGLQPKRLEFLTAAECQQNLPEKETVIKEVWDNFT